MHRWLRLHRFAPKTEKHKSESVPTCTWWYAQTFITASLEPENWPQITLDRYQMYLVHCQKVLSQSPQNEMSLAVIIGACSGGSFFHRNGFAWIKDERWLVFIISLFEIDISVHVTRDMWQHKLSCCMHNIWEIMFKGHMYILQPKWNVSFHIVVATVVIGQCL